MKRETRIAYISAKISAKIYTRTRDAVNMLLRIVVYMFIVKLTFKH